MAENLETNVPAREITEDDKIVVLGAVSQAMAVYPKHGSVATHEVKPFTGMRGSTRVQRTLEALVADGKLRKSRWAENPRVDAFRPAGEGE